MSDLNSWEDDPAAQDDSLSRQTQQNLQINSPADAQQNLFRANASSFQPGAQSFQPSAQRFQPGQQYHQYGASNQPQFPPRNQGAGFPQYGQGGYSQYNQVLGGQFAQGGYNNAYNQQYGGYNQSSQASQGFQSQTHPSQQWQAPVIAKRPLAGSAAGGVSSEVGRVSGIARENGTNPAIRAPSAEGANSAKILSIGGEAPKAKVLSISATTPSSEPAQGTDKKESLATEDGSKTIAAKAIEKTEKNNDKAASSRGASSTPTSGKSSPTRADTKQNAREADAVAKEQAADVDVETLEEVYGKEHVNLIFIGHVDAGKSTLGGSILYATGMVDERTMEKYKKEAKDAGRETWYLSWALDLTKEERAKGKTVEVGRGFFETEKRRYTILDAPGHKTFVPNMIGGASQADVGILVISARKGEYETGFEKGGQTREHAMLAKTQGVNKLVVVVNKMDDPTVEWSKERYEECTTKLKAFLRSTGYDPKNGEACQPIFEP